jgi:hypothetical protein
MRAFEHRPLYNLVVPGLVPGIHVYLSPRRR